MHAPGPSGRAADSTGCAAPVCGGEASAPGHRPTRAVRSRAPEPGQPTAHLAGGPLPVAALLPLLLLVLLAHPHAPHDLSCPNLAVPLYRLLPVNAAALLQPRQARVIRAPDNHGRSDVRAQRVPRSSGAIGSLLGPVRRLPRPVALDLARCGPALLLLGLELAHRAQTAHAGRSTASVGVVANCAGPAGSVEGAGPRRASS
jgi:hypothetical protein